MYKPVQKNVFFIVSTCFQKLYLLALMLFLVVNQVYYIDAIFKN